MEESEIVWLELAGSWQKYAKSVADADAQGISNENLGPVSQFKKDRQLFSPANVLVCFGDTKIALDKLLEAKKQLDIVTDTLCGTDE